MRELFELAHWHLRDLLSDAYAKRGLIGVLSGLTSVVVAALFLSFWWSLVAPPQDVARAASQVQRLSTEAEAVAPPPWAQVVGRRSTNKAKHGLHAVRFLVVHHSQSEG